MPSRPATDRMGVVMEADSPSPAPTTTVAEDAVIVRIVGDVDMANSDDLREHCVDLLDDGADALVLDLSEVSFFASSGIAALGHIRTHNASLRQRPVHVVASRSVRRSLQVTAMDKLLPLHDTLDDALTAVRAAAN
ncbi:STAS domain-containing protein [Actinosynnema sp. NPDC053489]|uniref:STAS domain-containing protein n=1 Tax=Actinosynnema sp. NPDC053489 TaxID=3363916 RepID=UPI0037C7A6F7